MTLTIASLVLIVGLVLYLLPGPPKVTEIGRILFFVGAFALVFGGVR